jgi:hypothetical protein
MRRGLNQTFCGCKKSSLYIFVVFKQELMRNLLFGGISGNLVERVKIDDRDAPAPL